MEVIQKNIVIKYGFRVEEENYQEKRIVQEIQWV